MPAGSLALRARFSFLLSAFAEDEPDAPGPRSLDELTNRAGNNR